MRPFLCVLALLAIVLVASSSDASGFAFGFSRGGFNRFGGGFGRRQNVQINNFGVAPGYGGVGFNRFGGGYGGNFGAGGCNNRFGGGFGFGY